MTTQDISGAKYLRDVRLYGHLARKFGKVHRLAVTSCKDAIQALCELLPGFKQHVLAHNMPGYHVFGGKRKASNSRSAETLDAPLGAGEPVCIVPAVAGAKKNGFLQTVIGVAMIVVGVFTGQPWLVQAGIAVTVGGIAQMLTPVQKADEADKDPRLTSYAFDGPVNSTRAGGPVPVVFGEFICGSAVISQGLYSEDLA
jgi:predicted phage tail protein